MDTLLQALASYIPTRILRRIAADPAPITAPTAERFAAAALFADVSGFTGLNERMARQGPSGVETLTQMLNLYFGQLIELVAAHGGDVVKFAGDGLLALWPDDGSGLDAATLRAAQCGLAVQIALGDGGYELFEDVIDPPTPLMMRIAIAAGDVTLMHLGGVFGRWEALVAGEPLSQLGRVQHLASPGDVVIAAETLPLIAERGFSQALLDGGARLDGLRDVLPVRALAVPELRPDMDAALRAYIPKAVLSRVTTGQIAWLADFRRVTVFFINIPDLNADTSLEEAQTAMYAIQQTLYRYEGSINRLGADDKGPTLLAALGLPPLAHEDDALRGVEAARGIQSALRDLGLRSAIGIATGAVFCGSVGNDTRREYTMMGVTVNLAARLMQAALANERTGDATLICDEATYQAARRRLNFEPLGAIHVKGKTEATLIYRPLAAPESPIATPTATLIGRADEQAFLTECLHTLLRRNSGGTVLIEGDAGIGKSALAEHFRRQSEALGITTLIGAGSAIEQSTLYFAWRSIFSRLFDLNGDDSPPPSNQDARRRRVLDRLQTYPDGLRLSPLLNAALALDLPENDITEQMSGQVRAANIRSLLLDILETATRPAPGRTVVQPLVLIIEDAQWLDSASWDLALALGQKLDPQYDDRLPILLVIAARPFEEHMSVGRPATEYQQVRYLAGTQWLRLRGMSREETLTLIRQCLDSPDLPEFIGEHIYRKTQGNPFFSEELACTLRDSGLLQRNQQLGALDPSIISDIQLPDTLQGLITSRIDRLTPEQQLALKTASVVGNRFSFRLLHDIYPVIADRPNLTNHVFRLQQAGLVILEEFEPDLNYAFKHTITRDVAYHLMVFAQRRQLHRAVAEWYERAYAHDLAACSSLLAHHWIGAGMPERAVDYLEQAGYQALSSGVYHEAIACFSDALSLSAPAAQRSRRKALRNASTVRRARWERRLGEAYHGLGRLAESRERLERAVDLLGWPAPATPRQVLASLPRQVIRQVLHRLSPWLIRIDPLTRRMALLEAARAYALLSQLHYYDNQMLATLYAVVRGLNLAERAISTPELVQAYASMQVAASGFGLRTVARFYRRRAALLITRVDYLPARIWVCQANALCNLHAGEWNEARRSLESAINFAEQIGDRRRWLENKALLTWSLSRQGHFARAIELDREIYAEAHRSGDVQAQTWALLGQAENMLPSGQSTQATALLAEAEALLAENIDRARAEEIWTYALLALTSLIHGDQNLAHYVVGVAAQLMDQAPQTAIYAFDGYTGIAEAYLRLWEQYGRGERCFDPTFASGGEDKRCVAPTYADHRRIMDATRRVCTMLGRYMGKTPVMQPRTWLWQGLYAWLSGEPQRAWSFWQRSLAAATRLGMPYDQGLAHYEMGRHSVGNERRRHIEQALRLFSDVGAVYDVERTRALMK